MNPGWLILVAVVFVIGDVIKARINADSERLLIHALIAKTTGEVKVLQTSGPPPAPARRRPVERELEIPDAPIRAMGL